MDIYTALRDFAYNYSTSWTQEQIENAPRHLLDSAIQNALDSYEPWADDRTWQEYVGSSLAYFADEYAKEHFIGA
tara:strand:- start:118 stop:342 length:225 start_codon:yes stop_codon:yes gene_type:complete